MHAPSSRSQWPDLPPDVLRVISGRLHDAADYVHFHAVCKPWRSSHETATTLTQSFLPWLLAPDKMNPYSVFLKLRSVFSRTSFRALPPFSVRPREWVASADGTAMWYFAARPSPSLRDPLTGAVALLLPPIPHDNGWFSKHSPKGIVYNDGTVLLCTVTHNRSMAMLRVRAALLRPGDAAWNVVERTFGSSKVCETRVAYHRGKTLIVLDGPVVPLSADDGRYDVLLVSRLSMPGELGQTCCVSCFLLESRGELMCVSVLLNLDYPEEFGGKASVPGLVRALSMSVHTLEEEEAGKIRWVRKDGRSLADRVLFLGWPNSFAVDTSRLNGDAVRGGCAYFVYYDFDARQKDKPCYVLRYDLVHDKAKFIEQLPQGWDDHMSTWISPQPSISPIQVITDRLEARKWWKKKNLHTAPTPWSKVYIERPQPKYYNPYFRVFVRNLPRNVDSFQLQQFFSRHGNVSNAKVMCKRKTKKVGLVTIAMVEEQADALAALNGLVFNGNTLEVRLVQRWKGRRVPPGVSNYQRRDHLMYIGLLMLLFVITVLWSTI